MCRTTWQGQGREMLSQEPARRWQCPGPAVPFRSSGCAFCWQWGVVLPASPKVVYFSLETGMGPCPSGRPCFRLNAGKQMVGCGQGVVLGCPLPCPSQLFLKQAPRPLYLLLPAFPSQPMAAPPLSCLGPKFGVALDLFFIFKWHIHLSKNSTGNLPNPSACSHFCPCPGPEHHHLLPRSPLLLLPHPLVVSSQPLKT